MKNLKNLMNLMNLKMMFIFILLGAAAVMLLKQNADKGENDSGGSLGGNSTFNNSITIDACKNYTTLL